MASLDNKVDFPIDVFYFGNKGGAHYIEELYRKIMDVAQRCSGCQEQTQSVSFTAIIVSARRWSTIYAPHLVILTGIHSFALVVSV